MGFVLNSVPGANNSIEYLSNSTFYVWGGSNNSVVANANAYVLISGQAPSAEKGFGTDLALGANRLIVRSGTSGNTAVYSLTTNTIIYRPNNRGSGGYENARQLAIIGDKMIIASGAGTSNVYLLNNTYVSTLSWNATVVSETLFNTSGYSLAAADNRIAVGMPRDLAGGQVRVFNYNGEMLFDIIPARYRSLIKYFGDSLDVGDGVIAIGSKFTDYGGVQNSGWVELYDYNGFFIKGLPPATLYTNGFYGGVLGIGSGVLAIAYQQRNIFDIHTLEGILVRTVTLPSGAEIASIKVKYGKIFVGVPSLPVSFNRGYVYVYDIKGNLLQTIIPSTINNARFGAAIDVGYGYLAVGANTNTVSGTANSGSVLLYKIHPAHTIEDAAYVTYNGD